jgi:hypothetical protein
MAPSAAIPPATDNPIIVPVPTDVLLLLASPPLVLEGVAEDEEEVLEFSLGEVTVTVKSGSEDDVDWLVVELLDGMLRLGPVMVGRPVLAL